MPETFRVGRQAVLGPNNGNGGSGGEPDSAPVVNGRWRRIAFWVSVALVFLFLLVALLPAYPLIVVNWLPHDMWLAVRTDHGPADLVHRLHSLALAVIAWGMFMGIALQAHRPRRKVALLLVSLAVPIAIAVGEMLAGTYTVAGTAPFIIAILLVTVLHPAARELLRPPRWDLPMLGLTALAAAPWIVYAVHTGDAARDAGRGFEVDHLTFMGALAVLVLLWGIIGASDRRGWHFAAGAALVASGFIALQSIIYPNVLSGLSGAWAAAALAWCLAYAGAAALRLRATERAI